MLLNIFKRLFSLIPSKSIAAAQSNAFIPDESLVRFPEITALNYINLRGQGLNDFEISMQFMVIFTRKRINFSIELKGEMHITTRY